MRERFLMDLDGYRRVENIAIFSEISGNIKIFSGLITDNKH